MALENVHDTIDRHGMWQMLSVYGVGRKLLKAVQSFYVDRNACVLVRTDGSELRQVNVGLRQGCVMSPCLFNINMDGIVPEVNSGVLWRGAGAAMIGGRVEINQLLFSDDTALMAN